MDPLPPMQPMKPMEPLRFERWWPANLGEPSSAGGQNGLRFAVFPDKRRLLVEQDGRCTTYDLGEHRITGVQSQGQGGGPSTVALASQHGPLRLDDLPVVGGAEARQTGDSKHPQQDHNSDEHAEPRRRGIPESSEPVSSGSSSHAGNESSSSSERVVFSEEGHGGRSIKLVVRGTLDAELIEAAEDFLRRQRRRLSRP